MKQLLIGIISGKGGVGKSTTTEMVATFLNRYYDYKIAVIDADPQASISDNRETELRLLKNKDIRLIKAAKELIDNNKNLYNIYKLPATDKQKIAGIKNSHDITFIDIPGSLDVPGVLEILFFLDYVLIPLKPDTKTFKSSIETIKNLIAHRKHGARIKNIGVFINEFHEVKFKKENLAMLDFFKSNNISVLKPIYYNVEVKKSGTSTIKAMSWGTEPKNIYHFVENLLNFINLN